MYHDCQNHQIFITCIDDAVFRELWAYMAISWLQFFFNSIADCLASSGQHIVDIVTRVLFMYSNRTARMDLRRYDLAPCRA